MNNIQPMVRAGELVQGKTYKFHNRFNGFSQEKKLVTFADYTACPAVVIVRDDLGRIHRCSRRDLFVFSGKDEIELPTDHFSQ